MSRSRWLWSLWILMGWLGLSAAPFAAMGQAAPGVPGVPGGRGSDGVAVSTQWSADGVPQGGQGALAVVLDIKPPLHIYDHELNDELGLIPTRIEVVAAPDGLAVGAAQFPEPKPLEVNYTGRPQTVPVHEGRTVVYLPVAADAAAPLGEHTLRLRVSWQACDDRACYMPQQRELSVPVNLVPPGAPVTPMAAALFTAFDPAAFAQLGAATAPGQSASFDFFGLRFDIAGDGLPAALGVLAVALVVGVLLNLTPCVLPVVPLKVLALHQHAGQRRWRTLLLGLSFSAGILACFGVLGMLAASLTLQWGQQFSAGWFTLGLGLIVAAMALNMMGLLGGTRPLLPLPQAVYQLTPRLDTHPGSFLFGVLAAVLSTPCTGPMFAGALGWAVKQPAWLGLSVFLVMGFGMALPYLVLAAYPKWVDRLPRTGPGSVLIKQVLGALLLAVAVYFIGIAGQPIWGQAYGWVIAAVTLGAMGWLTLRLWQLTARRGPRLTFTGAGVLTLAATGWLMLSPGVGQGEQIRWTPYSPAALAEARAAGKTVVLEFTADWCLNCKALEATVLSQARVVGRLGQPGVVPMRVDLTSQSNAEGWAKLRELGATGIPLTAVCREGQSEPTLLTSLYPAEALLRATEQ